MGRDDPFQLEDSKHADRTVRDVEANGLEAPRDEHHVPRDEHHFLICPIADWSKFDNVKPWIAPALLAVGVYLAVTILVRLGGSRETAAFVIATGMAGVLIAFLLSRCVWRRAMLREVKRRRTGSTADRFRARDRLATLRGKRGWARLCRTWPGPRAVLIGLLPDLAALREVQVFEPIDVSVEPRAYSSARAVKYRDIHVTAVTLAFGVTLVFTTIPRFSGIGWGLWFLASLPVAWGLVWLYRQRRVSSVAAIMPIQLLSTLVEPGRVTRTVLGVSREFESESGLLIVRAFPASRTRHMKAQTTETLIHVTLINPRGHRSNLVLRGADHPTIADVIARWVHPLASSATRSE